MAANLEIGSVIRVYILLVFMLLPAVVTFAQDTLENEKFYFNDLGGNKMSIYVIGHKNPDTDSICSAIGAAHLRQVRGEEAAPARCGEINKETAYALEKFGVEAPVLVEKVTADDQIIMVDHNELAQAVDGIQDAKIIALVDHHRLGGIETADPISVRIKPVGCTATIIANMHWHRSIEIPQDIAGLLLSAIISDTVLFKSPTTTALDKEAAEQLAAIAGVELQAYGMELLKAGAGVGDMTPAEIIATDSKPFTFGATKAVVSQISVMDPKEVLDMKAQLLDAMKAACEANGTDMYMTMVTDILNESTDLVFYGENKALIAEAFQKEVAADCDCINLPGVMSRKKQIVPPLTEAAKRI